MKITILCVGKIKKKFLTEAVNDYKTRLSSQATVDIIEVADEKTPDGASAATEEKIREKEGKRLLEKMPKDAYKIALAIDGKKLSSEHFSEKIDNLMISGVSHIVFIIGGSIGLSPEVLQTADMKLSFSDMTFPHQLMRVILLEQVYRAYKIIKNEPYHK